MPTVKQLAESQAIYMQYLLERAKKKAATATNLPFDPQGRVLIDVTLTMEDWANIAASVNVFNERDISVAELKKELRIDTKAAETTTTVSLDIAQDKHLAKQFDTQLENTLKQNKVADKKITAIQKALQTQPKGSIIALQQEFHFHLGLASRVYQKADRNFEGKEQELQRAHEAAVKEVNQLVLAAYAKALEKSIDKNGHINVKKLNEALDKARKNITPQAHTILMKQVVAKTGVILTKPDESTLKHLAEETTATPNDVLHTSHEQELAMLIRGTESTAHHRQQGEEFSHRQLITQVLTADGIKPNIHPRIQIRTPSPVVKTGLQEKEYIDDVALKFNTITTDYSLKENLSGGQAGGKPKAFIYNSLTAINDSLGDTGGNLQTQSAHHILKGAHTYNAQQLTENNKPVFCFVQNISVNGFGDHLGYNSGDALTEESTIMTEMAILHTLYDTVSVEQQEKIRSIFSLYNEFLNNRKQDEYFSSSPQGKGAIAEIQDLKNLWKTGLEKIDNTFVAQAQNSLKLLIANDLHFNHDYAKLIQSLSVFVEEASLVGCKSGNERAQAINGRVSILDAVLNAEHLTNDGKAIKESVEKFSTADSQNINEVADRLKLALDTVYNKIGLQTAASIVSLVDQGASAKVEAKPGHPFYVSRNYAEEKASVLPNLQQTKAGAMQAHKGLASSMASAWSGHPVSWWSRMKSSPLGIVGAIVGTIAFPVAIVVALVSSYQNSNAKASTIAENIQLQTQYKPEPININGGSDRVMQNAGLNHTDSSESLGVEVTEGTSSTLDSTVNPNQKPSSTPTVDYKRALDTITKSTDNDDLKPPSLQSNM
ncbi:hypothetical protein [Legionella hackeliae]|uniref:Uncharacterized protein n=1 Tax=Legionella hackeliae TaxID=449 RepID=A0A0A8URI1_LEGHA|nr:hypothetical protein [Legionella hackeliae]KTD15162.1 hypothetical protein Lhac_0004 [Legionella hackeliae]CEK11475.1 conserved protein of unknown function [coiled-coil domain] [Legionella hackeliae]STX48245.1 Uncharacterised protein [Legionella hackeliae]